MFNNILDKTDFSRALIARKMGVSRAYITQLLSGKKNITLKTLSDFCSCCGFELDIRIRKKKQSPSSENIPLTLKPLFWEADFPKLDPVTHKGYILERILNRGSEKAVQWMRSRYSKREIINYINKHLRLFSPKNLNFWAFVYGKEDKWKIPLNAPNATSWQGL